MTSSRVTDNETHATRPAFGASRLGGISYVAVSVGFMAVFSWLASNFGYPDVLDRPADEVLPRLIALGSTGRSVWAIYAALPLVRGRRQARRSAA